MLGSATRSAAEPRKAKRSKGLFSQKGQDTMAKLTKKEERVAATVSVSVRIEGVSPLLMARIPPGALPRIPGAGAPVTVNKPTTERAVAESMLYTDEGGAPVIPHTNLFACLIEGGRYHKAGGKLVSTMKSSMIPACCEMRVADYPLETKAGWVVDSRIFRNAKTGDPGWTHRPRFDDWAVEFELIVDTTMMPPEVLRMVLETSGKRVGLCAYTPRHRGPFGKFKITKWEVTVLEWVEAA